MGQAYFLHNRHRLNASFDYFFRKIPFGGGYVVFAGLENLLEIIEQWQFDEYDIDYLHKSGFHSGFLEYLSSFRFKGNILGMNEGEIVFPVEPVLRVEGGLLETQLVETLLLNVLNFQSLIATKAQRIRWVAGDKVLSDFGLRRAQGSGGNQASRAAFIGGFNSTSNMYAARKNKIPSAGTMAHSFILSYKNELEAFRAYAAVFPDNCVLLVDTFDTLKSGLPNAIIVARELERKGKKLAAVRLDSGDLADLSKRTRIMLDNEGLDYVKIVASNQLDEYVIKDLLEQNAPVDVFGVGTSMVTGIPDGALDGVYKLCSLEGEARLKWSDSIQKATLPGQKQVLRYTGSDGQFYGDCIILEEETAADQMTVIENNNRIVLADCQSEQLFTVHMKDGKRCRAPVSIMNVQEMTENRMKQLPGLLKELNTQHTYAVGVSDKLMAVREKMKRPCC